MLAFIKGGRRDIYILEMLKTTYFDDDPAYWACTRDIYSLAKIMGSNAISTAGLLRQDIIISNTVVCITCKSKYNSSL
jgi:hypothetical protein